MSADQLRLAPPDTLEKINEPEFGGCPTGRLEALTNNLAPNLASGILITLRHIAEYVSC